MTVNAPHKIDKFIPWMFVLFFVVVAIVDGIFMTTAVKTHTGVVTEDAYETGLKYNQILADVREQEKRGWSHQLNITKDGAIQFSLKDKAGKAITGAQISALYYRAIQGGMDQTIQLSETDTGIYTGKADLKANGLWQVFVTAKVGTDTYKTNQDILIEK